MEYTFVREMHARFVRHWTVAGVLSIYAMIRRNEEIIPYIYKNA